MSVQAVMQSAGAAREEIVTLACVDRSTGLLLGAYTAPARGSEIEELVHAVVDVPDLPGLVMMGSSRAGTLGGLERVLVELARGIGERA